MVTSLHLVLFYAKLPLRLPGETSFLFCFTARQAAFLSRLHQPQKASTLFLFSFFLPSKPSASWVVPCSVGWMLRGSLFAAREPQEGTGKQLTQEEHSAETTLDAEPRWIASPRRTPSPRATTCYLTWRKSLHVSINGFLEAQVHMLYLPGQVAHIKSDVQTGAV